MLLTVAAKTVEVKTSLWTGSQAMGNWEKWVQIDASAFTNAEVGQVIDVHVAALDAPGTYHQVMLNNGSWATLAGSEAVNLSSAPTDARFTITDAMLTELKSGGLIVKGAYYTADAVFLIKEVESSAKGNPLTTIWKGTQKIDWNDKTGNCWLSMPASLFTNAKSGNRLRFYFSHLAIGAQGNIVTGDWKQMPGLPATNGYTGKNLTASYFEYDITDATLTSLQSNGCIVSGVGFTLDSVCLVDMKCIPLINATVNDADIRCWEKGETPVLRVNLENLEDSKMTTDVTLTLRTDSYSDVATMHKSVELAAGDKQTVTFDLSDKLQPGFYHAVVEGNYSLLKDFNIGYDPTDITSTVDAQSDFKTFWDKAKSDLKAVDPEYKLTLQESLSTGKKNVYLVEMKSVDNGDGKPVTIRGYYAEPKAEGTYPAIIMENGYDSGYEPYIPSTDGDDGWCILTMSNRGQLVNNRAPYKDENSFYGDWFQYNFGNKDTYYYRGAYMDVVRAINFIASRDKVQQQNIFMTGASQGGAYTIAGAALGDGRLNAIAPAIQFMGDFPNYFKVGAWPANYAERQRKSLGITEDAMYAFLSYFDMKNLAPYVFCPVTTSIGLQDPVCPPRTNFAPYNHFASTEKAYIVNPTLQHATPTTWYNIYMDFFKKHLKNNTAGISNIEKEQRTDSACYNLNGQHVDKSYRGVVIRNGRKYVQR